MSQGKVQRLISMLLFIVQLGVGSLEGYTIMTSKTTYQEII
jgi:hypothetical protein